jgi:hypothetical protein
VKRSGVERGNIGMFLYVLVWAIRGYLRARSEFAAICVGIFGRLTGSRVSNREHWHVPLRWFGGFAAIRVGFFRMLTGSRVSNGEHWHVPLRFGLGDSRPFAGAQRIRGHSRWDAWQADWFTGVERKCAWGQMRMGTKCAWGQVIYREPWGNRPFRTHPVRSSVMRMGTGYLSRKCA